MNLKASILLLTAIINVFLISCQKDDYREQFLGNYDVVVDYKQASNSPTFVDTSYVDIAQVSMRENYENDLEISLSAGAKFYFEILSNGHFNLSEDVYPNYTYVSGSFKGDSLIFTHTFNPNNLLESYKVRGER